MWQHDEPLFRGGVIDADFAIFCDLQVGCLSSVRELTNPILLYCRWQGPAFGSILVKSNYRADSHFFRGAAK